MFYCEGCENEEQFKNEEAKKQQEQQPVVDEATDIPEDEADQDEPTDEQLTKSQKQPTVEQQTNNSISIQKQPPSLRDSDNNNNNNNNKAKYSMSLPREIPDMLFKYAKKRSTDNSKQTGAAESTVRKQTVPAPDPTLSVSFQNVTNASLIEELKRDMVTAANTQQTSAADSLNRQSGGGGDENRSSSLADEETDKFNEENNIGEAISYLASSIIAKDGRELFGYRPSRRVQVNCISQSYF